jgi:hypothetical protein
MHRIHSTVTSKQIMKLFSRDGLFASQKQRNCARGGRISVQGAVQCLGIHLVKMYTVRSNRYQMFSCIELLSQLQVFPREDQPDAPAKLEYFSESLPARPLNVREVSYVFSLPRPRTFFCDTSAPQVLHQAQPGQRSACADQRNLHAPRPN